MASNDETERMAAKVRALMQKTTENGCTEDEALAAAAKAAEIMAAHRLTMTDVEIGQEKVGTMTLDDEAGPRHYVGRYCAMAIGRYTGTRVWGAKEKRGARAVETTKFFGLYQDTLFAKQLFVLCAEAVERGVRDFKQGELYAEIDSARRAGASKRFQAGMAIGMSRKLEQMTKEQEAAPPVKTATGSSLVVVRGALVAEGFKKLGLNLRAGRSARILGDGALAAGKAAGAGVSFNRALNGGTGTLGIGRS